MKQLGDDDRGLWSAQWARGALYAATLGSVERIDVATGRAKVLLPGDGSSEVPDNHSLFSNGTDVAFVCGGKLFVLDGDKFVLAKLGR